MRRLFPMLLLLWIQFLVMACGHGKVTTYRLTGIENFSTEEQATIQDTLSFLNEKLGRTVIATDGNGTMIHIAPKNFEKLSSLGYATRTLGGCNIDLANRILGSKDYLGSVLLHEIGHCFGKAHDDKSGELMSAITLPLNHYSTEKIDAFLSQLSLSVKVNY